MRGAVEEVAELALRRAADFHPGVRTRLRENLSMLAVGSRVLRPRPAAPPPDPDRVPVLLVPGFLSGDFAMRPMADALRAAGHWTAGAHIAPNAGCTIELADAVEERLIRIARRRGRQVALVGWSRGGTLAALVTRRRPDLVASLVTLASPNMDPLAINRTLAHQVRLLTRLHSWGVHGVLGQDCLSGECAARVHAALTSDFPAGVPYLAVFSTSDGVVDWRACLDPAAEQVEVDATHMAMGADPGVIELVVDKLDQVAERDAGAA